MRSATSDPALITLAQRAGILTRWQDATGQTRHVDDDVLRHLLDALELNCNTPEQIKTSLHQLEHDSQVADGDLVVVRRGERPHIPCNASGGWELILESGQVHTGKLKQDRPGQISLEPVMETGYHQLRLGQYTLTLAVVPERAPAVPTVLANQPRPWGLVAQIYSLHQEDHRFPPWLRGGNFSAVGQLAISAAREGASAVALSPAHAMFSADPSRYSPYSPSSRLLLNVVYADPIQVLGGDLVRQALSNWDNPDDLHLMDSPRRRDWPRIASLRLRLLREAFYCFREQGTAALKRRLEAFRRDRADALRDHAIYETLHGYYADELGPGHGWQDWPAALQDSASGAVADFAEQFAEDVDFHVFAQWLASEGLQQAQVDARAAGMSCGLISDLAIGTDPRGSHAWSLQNDILTSVSVGAPPDIYQALGQNWGLTAFSPRGLRRGAYRAFIETLRAGFRSAGGIRIDHIAGMERLWLIPAGAMARDGAYLSYPKHELLGLITLEASRHDAIVIGENLGTVSDELNRSLADHGLLGTSVLWFERDEESVSDTDTASASDTVAAHADEQPSRAGMSPFRPPQQWPDWAIAMPSTHDLPTVHGWWQERDLLWRALMDSQSRTQRESAQAEREVQRTELWRALRRNSPGLSPDTPDDTPLDAVLAYVARTPAPLALFSLEDLLAIIDQPNMPGGNSGDQLVHHPNWLQRLPATIDAEFSRPDIQERIRTIARARSAL